MGAAAEKNWLEKRLTARYEYVRTEYFALRLVS